jgi:creatinine amidohydrolase/Fe(II)-dependent formamide hydrolase-like protein
VPGNMFWLRPKTFHNLLFDVYEAMRRRGFRAIVVLNGHWSIEHNVAAIRATGEEFRRAHPTTGWLLLTNQEVVPDRHYPVEHTAGGETSLLLAIHPNLIASTRRLSLTARCSLTTPINQDTWDGAARARTSTSASTQRLRTYRTIQKARRSSVGRALLETIVERVAARARTVLAETTSGDQ